MKTEVIILAAGKGTRMYSDLPKVLHPVAGKPMLQWILETVSDLENHRIHVVIGYGSEVVQQRCSGFDVNWVIQAAQNGTGHAVAQALPFLQKDSRVLVLNGDAPFIGLATLQDLLGSNGDELTLLTVVPPKARGLGRILRHREDGRILAVVEEKDASEQQREITEIYTGILSSSARTLVKYITLLDSDNQQGEYYLTDIVAMAARDKMKVCSVDAVDFRQVAGINNKQELASSERYYQQQQATALMLSGVTLLDPARLDIRGQLKCGRDCSIDINCIFEGDVVLEDGVSIGANCIITDSRIGRGAAIAANTIVENTVVGESCKLGPFARTRPETVLASNVRIGNFVEIKKSKIDSGSKVNHLSYIGDSEIGERVNIGAGVITCNYDGVNKHQTQIGDDAFVGSNVALVAPVKIGAGATIGAGTTLGKNAPPGKLTIERGKQLTLSAWKRAQKKQV